MTAPSYKTHLVRRPALHHRLRPAGSVVYWPSEPRDVISQFVLSEKTPWTHDNHFTGGKSVPTPLSCTSVLQTWTKDTGDSLQGIRPEPIDQLVVRKPKISVRCGLTRPTYCSEILCEYRVPHLLEREPLSTGFPTSWSESLS
ncbi:unnamed protein product [Gadus morhua 'NCC']